MTREELGIQTPRSFQNKVKGFFEFEQDKTTNDEILRRYQTGLLMNATGNYGKQGIKIQKIWKIPSFDKMIAEQSKVSQEEMKKVVDKYAKAFKDE